MHSHAYRQPHPMRRAFGWSAVIVLHIALIHALVTGLAHRLVEAVHREVVARVIEQDRPPPKPLPLPVVPPQLAPPPPVYVPPPEVIIARPKVAAPTITVAPTPPPPKPDAFVPLPPPAPAPAPPAPPAPPPNLARAARLDVAHCAKPEYPYAARRSAATGTTSIEFIVDRTGRVTRAALLHASGFDREHRALDRAAIDALSRCHFEPGRDTHGQPSGGRARVDYVWQLED